MKRLSATPLCCLLACLSVLIFSNFASASGFALYEWSARGNGMGGCMTGLADDPSALAYNPAGITQLEGTQVMGGVSFIAPTAKVSIGGSTTNTKHKVYAAPHAYLTHKYSDTVSFGLGMFTRFGVGTNYNNAWAGTEIPGGGVYKASVEAISVVPTMALKVTDDWSVAAGFEFMRVNFDQRKRYETAVGSGNWVDAKIMNDGNTVGFNLSTHYKFNDEWSAGLMFRSTQKMVGHGDLVTHLNGLPFGGDDVSLTAYLPASVSAGVAWKVNEDLTLDFDVIWTKWEDYKHLYYDYNSQADVRYDKMWRNTWRLGLGAEYKLGGGHIARAGYVWDQSPLRDGYEDFMLPTNDRQIISLGYGFDKGSPLTLDLGAMYVMMADRSVDPGVSISQSCEFKDSSAIIASFSVGYKF